MTARTALITGVTGQDGSYLAEQLLADGWSVTGTTRDPAAARGRLPATLVDHVELVPWLACDLDGIVSLLSAKRPAAVFNLAARSSGVDMNVDPVEIVDVNASAVACLLEGIARVDREIRFCQASSSEMFGDAQASPQSEATEFRPRSAYGAAKLLSHHLVGTYRRQYGIHASSAILYNHESPRRGAGFVTGKIVQAAVRISRVRHSHLALGCLDARRDWGYAPDYVHAMRLMLAYHQGDDYVIATGRAHSVRDFCELAFAHVGLDYRDFVKVDQAHYRAPELVPLVGDASKARAVLGWEPTRNFSALVRELVDAELARID